MLLSKQTKMSIRSEHWAQLWLYRTTSVSPTSFFDVTQEPLCVCYPFLQLLHKADGIAECLPLLTGQRLQVQDGLRALSLEDADGLQQSLITDTKGGEVRQQLRGGGEGDISIIQLDTAMVQCIKLSDPRRCIIHPRRWGHKYLRKAWAILFST